MKKTYACIGYEGVPFRRTTDRVYTHAIVEFSPAGNPLRAIAFCGSKELAEKRKRAEEEYLIATTLEVVDVTEINGNQCDAFL